MQRLNLFSLLEFSSLRLDLFLFPPLHLGDLPSLSIVVNLSLSAEFFWKLHPLPEIPLGSRTTPPPRSLNRTSPLSLEISPRCSLFLDQRSSRGDPQILPRIPFPRRGFFPLSWISLLDLNRHQSLSRADFAAGRKEENEERREHEAHMDSNLRPLTLNQSGTPVRFHPTVEELVDYYLRKKVASRRTDFDVIKDIDLYKIEPWDLQEKCKIGSEEHSKWYFFSHKEKKYPNESRTNRATTAGFWKATRRDKFIYSNHKLVGMRKTLVFYKGRALNGLKSDWIMHEYRLETNENATPQVGWSRRPPLKVVAALKNSYMVATLHMIRKSPGPAGGVLFQVEPGSRWF